MQDISSKLTLIYEDLQELFNITRSHNDINVSQIVDTLKRELKISFNIVEEQPFPNSQDQIRTDSLQNIFNIRKPILSINVNLLDICCIDVVSILHFKSVYSSSNTYVNKILKSQMKSVCWYI
jgi:hypothetical protein